MQTTYTKKFNVKVEAVDLIRLFRVLGYFNDASIVDPEIRDDALQLLNDFKDIREVVESPTETIFFAADLTMEARYVKDTPISTLTDIFVPGEVLPPVSTEAFEEAPELLPIQGYHRGC